MLRRYLLYKTYIKHLLLPSNTTFTALPLFNNHLPSKGCINFSFFAKKFDFSHKFYIFVMSGITVLMILTQGGKYMSETKTVIAEDAEITGSIKCSSDIEIDGKLNGDLTCSGNVTVGASAIIKGNITSNNITVLGQINGNIIANEKVDLKSSARISGDVKAKRLVVEDGVMFTGKCEVAPAKITTEDFTAVSHVSTSAVEEKIHIEQEKTESKGRTGLFGRK
jgi:cytoskeletal protein CcmA (bactofilin family)